MLLVKLSSPGPVFFRQTRVGMGGRPFQVVKFRTMRTDAEAAGAKWATKDDPRVTPVGRFMRKTRLDEVPQLWNVLIGDMGFVGPPARAARVCSVACRTDPLFRASPYDSTGAHGLGASPLRLRRHAGGGAGKNSSTTSTTSSTSRSASTCSSCSRPSRRSFGDEAAQ